MPQYLFRNKQTDQEFFEFMGISQREQFLIDNPHIEQLVHGFPSIGYSTTTRKPDNGFRDVLKEVKRKHRKSTINTW